MILAKTIKGYGLGEAGEGRNITHQQKKLNEEELREFRRRFDIPISDEEVGRGRRSTSRPTTARRCSTCTSVARRWAVSCPAGGSPTVKLKPPKWEDFAEFFAGSEGREVSTTMAFVRLLARLMRDKAMGRYVVPIVPDEARTFGMEALFRQFGIYSHSGQLYEPVDSDTRALLPRGQRRADPRRGHHRGRLDGVVHRRRHGPFQPRREHDPVLHLLLDVRLPADRRPDLGGRRHALPRLPAGRHRRPHHAGRRRAPAPGRQQPPVRPGLSQPPGLRSVPTPTRWR